MTGTCSSCHHFCDDLVKVREGEMICKACMLEFAAAYEPIEESAADNEILKAPILE